MRIFILRLLAITSILISLVWLVITVGIVMVFSVPLFLLLIWFKKKLFVSVILFLLAKISSIGLYPVGFFYKLCKVILVSKVKISHLSDYLVTVAMAEDQKGNAVMGHFFNDVLISEKGYKYGNPDETISSATGKNQLRNTLTKVGVMMNKVLNKVEKNHSVLAIEKDETDTEHYGW